MLYKRIGTVSIATWNEQSVIYHHESGDTHLLDSYCLPFAEILISNDIVNSDDLLNRFSGLNSSMEQNQELVNNLLQQFAHLNILAPIDCECQ